MEMLTLVSVLASFLIIASGKILPRDQSNANFPKDANLKKIDGVSRLQCSHRCARDEHCKHTAYQKEGRKCTLLSGIRDTLVATGDDNGGIEDIEGMGGKFFTENVPMVYSPHRVVQSK